MDVDNIMTAALNLLSVLFDGRTWNGEGSIPEEDESNYFSLLKRKSCECNMLSVLLLIIEKRCVYPDHRSILIDAFTLSSKIILDNVSVPAVIATNMDPTKEFIVVNAIDHQLSMKERGPDAYGIVAYGCVLLEWFVRLYPCLRRNSTCKIIHRLLVDVYSLFVPQPYYFVNAIPVLDQLLKNEMNYVHFQHRSFFIYKFVKEHNSNSNNKLHYKDLESTLLTLSK